MKIEVNDTSSNYEKIEVNDTSSNYEKKMRLARENAIKDLLFVYSHPKMYINEKRYLINLIDLLFKYDYYYDGSIKSLFGDI